jgi:hypothetical protein
VRIILFDHRQSSLSYKGFSAIGMGSDLQMISLLFFVSWNIE